MPLGPQAKILRVLQEGFVRRIGGVEEIPVNARVITATNKKLADMVADGNFREDLFYRINVLNIQIPPLRERTIDIPLMVSTFLNQFNRKLQKPEQTVSTEALDKLVGYSWPGNVRELQNVIERASIISDKSEISADCINLNTKSLCCGNICQTIQLSPDETSLKEQVGEFERKIILGALNATSSIRQAAKKLKISHTALIRKIEKHKLRHESKATP